MVDRMYRFAVNDAHDLYNLMDDEAYLKKKYYLVFGKPLDLQNPKTYNEKLQWLKLYDRRPEYSMMVDKYEVKKYVASIIGEKYIIPTLGVWDKFEDIDFNALPKQFVLKCTHDSGGLVICRDKDKLDIESAKRSIQKAFMHRYFYQGREWPYKNVKPRIIAEQYMEDEITKELRDYKFFCFDGKVKALYVASDRYKNGEETKFDFYDENFQHLPFTSGHPNAKTPPEKPHQFEKMKELAERLSKGFPHVRVDLYDVNGSIFFGEMTFYHMSGFAPFVPDEWDKTFGDWLKLPEKHE